MPMVFVFNGHGSRFANAVFSSREAAAKWIARHGLTGLLTGYTLDEPAFDRHLADGTLPRPLRARLANDEIRPEDVQRFVDGSVHFHYVHGLGEGDPGYSEACDRWDRAQTGPSAKGVSGPRFDEFEPMPRHPAPMRDPRL